MEQDQILDGDEQIHQIRREWMQGMCFSQIARKHQIDPRTARRYALQNLPLRDLSRRDRSKLDPYRHMISLWMQEEGMTIAQIQRRLNQNGVCCGYMTVSDYLNKLRTKTD